MKGMRDSECNQECFKSASTGHFITLAARRSKTFRFDSSNLLKVSRTFGVDITLEYKREVVLSFLSPSASFLWESFLCLYIGGHFETWAILKKKYNHTA